MNILIQVTLLKTGTQVKPIRRKIACDLLLIFLIIARENSVETGEE
jgi:hypothetical protein